VKASIPLTSLASSLPEILLFWQVGFNSSQTVCYKKTTKILPYTKGKGSIHCHTSQYSLLLLPSAVLQCS